MRRSYSLRSSFSSLSPPIYIPKTKSSSFLSLHSSKPQTSYRFHNFTHHSLPKPLIVGIPNNLKPDEISSQINDFSELQIQQAILELKNTPSYTYIINDPALSSNVIQVYKVSESYADLMSNVKHLSPQHIADIFEILKKKLIHSLLKVSLSMIYSDAPCNFLITPEELLDADYSLFCFLLPYFENHITVGLIDQFICILNSPSKKEQFLASHLITQIFQTFSQYQNHIIIVFIKILTEFRDSTKYIASIAPILQFFADILQVLDISDLFKYFEIYRNIIFPFIRSTFLPSFFHEFINLSRIFISKDSTTALWGFRYIFRHWPVTSSDKQLIFIYIVQFFLSEIPITFVKPIQRQLVLHIDEGLNSPHFKVALATIKFINRQEIIELLSSENLSRIIKSLDRLSNHWFIDVRVGSKKALTSILSNKRETNAIIKNKDKQCYNSWMQLINLAKTNHRSIDVKQSQSDVKRFFKSMSVAHI